MFSEALKCSDILILDGSSIVLSDVDNLPQALKEAKDTLVNQKTAYYCRKHYLDNFTLDKFEDNLISVLKS